MTEQEQTALNVAQSLSASWLVSVLKVASINSPATIKGILESVYDFRTIEAKAHFVSAQMRSMGQDATETRELVNSVHKELDGLEQRLDGVVRAQEEIEHNLILLRELAQEILSSIKRRIA